MPKRAFSAAELAEQLLEEIRSADRQAEPASYHHLSGARVRAWLFALAELTAVKTWLAAQPDPVDLVVCYSPGQELMIRYLVSPRSQTAPLDGVPEWEEIAWVMPFMRRVDAIVEYARASERHPMGRDDLIALVDRAAETARLWRIFVYPDMRMADGVCRTLFEQVAHMIEARPQDVAAALRAHRDRAQALLDQVDPQAAIGAFHGED